MNENTTTNGLQLMSRKETGEYLGISLGTLKKLDIPCTKVGRKILYSRSLVDNWILENARENRSKAKQKKQAKGSPTSTMQESEKTELLDTDSKEKRR